MTAPLAFAPAASSPKPLIEIRWSLRLSASRSATLRHTSAVEASPGADLQRGIDVVGLRSLSTPMAVRTATSMLTGKGMTDGPDALVLSDQASIEVTSERALPLQVDGDLVGEVTHVTFRAVPEALRIVAASPLAR